MRGTKRLIAVCVAGGALLAGAWALPDHTVLRNVSGSMDLGYYIMTPWAKAERGSIVAFYPPANAAGMAKELCIDHPLLKRVFYRAPWGGLYVAGDHGGERSFDSRLYGSIAESEIIGVYRPVAVREPKNASLEQWSDPDIGKGTQDKPLRSEGCDGDAELGNLANGLTDPGGYPDGSRVHPDRTRVRAQW